jgi:hypothetical protein
LSFYALVLGFLVSRRLNSYHRGLFGEIGLMLT